MTISIKDLQYVVSRLNTSMESLNKALEEGNMQKANRHAIAVERRARMLASEIEFQTMFNAEEMKQYASNAADLDAIHYGAH